MRANETSKVRQAKNHTLSTKTLWMNFLSKMRVDKSSVEIKVNNIHIM
jgi:hypothetical protein